MGTVNQIQPNVKNQIQYTSNDFRNTICGMLFSPKENSESVSGFVAEQKFTNLLNLIYSLHTVHCIMTAGCNWRTDLKHGVEECISKTRVVF